MTKSAHPALLPAGLADILPPEAELEARSTESLMSTFAAWGYSRVKPPLIEFEDTLMSGSGAATADQSFRLMDPISQRMMAVRADMTIQIARIATSRFLDAPRPLRLSYAGQVLRVRGSMLRPERQFGQAGVELIGSTSPTADAEVILLAYQALKNLGIESISIDLGIPTLVTDLCRHLGIEDGDEISALRTALNQKDAAAIATLDDAAAGIFGSLLKAVGPASTALAVLRDLSLTDEAQQTFDHLASVINHVNKRAKDVTLTIDPVEIRGYEYHSGVTFTLFSPAVRGELGRGGRYEISAKGAPGEQATGVTLFIDTILRSLPAPKASKIIYAPVETDKAQIVLLREEGWVVVEALNNAEDPAPTARKLGCTHLLTQGKTEEL